MCAYKHACMHPCMHACVCARKNMHACIHASCICAFMQTCIHAYVRHIHMCIHANMHSCIHANMLAYVHKFTSMHAHMRASVHAVMPTYMHDERDLMSGVMRERERASVMQRKNDFTETILSPLTPDSFALSRSHQTSSFSLSLSPPTNLIPSLLLESRFSLFLSHSLSRHIRFYSNLSSHHNLISLSHIHIRTHIHRLLFFRALRELKKCESWPKP